MATADRLILDDLQRRPAEVRPRLRYLSLVHRHNEHTCTEPQLEAERTAVREMRALLSRGKSEVVGFDPNQLLFCIDLADLHWDAAIEWHKVVSLYRHGLRPTPAPEAMLCKQIEEQTQVDVPVVRADRPCDLAAGAPCEPGRRRTGRVRLGA
jgi:hypothetical protein